MFRLDGKVAIVTGCGSIGDSLSNGRAISLALARQGAIVYGLDRNLESAQETQARIEKEGGTCHEQTCDATRPEERHTDMHDCNTQPGRLDVLVNSVGASLTGEPLSMRADTWQRQSD